MKNPHKIFSKVFRSSMEVTPQTEVVTLESCYDHVKEDYPGFNLDELLFLKHDEFHLLGIQETEQGLSSKLKSNHYGSKL